LHKKIFFGRGGYSDWDNLNFNVLNDPLSIELNGTHKNLMGHVGKLMDEEKNSYVKAIVIRPPLKIFVSPNETQNFKVR
jgi:hypothetical protein